ncbi:hypothetical protein P8452_56405 [Trifolium repens]|nr:hypothetical protein P8452_56405 [Trifolium repens]
MMESINVVIDDCSDNVPDVDPDVDTSHPQPEDSEIVEIPEKTDQQEDVTPVFYVKLIFHFCDLVLAKVKGFAAWPATKLQSQFLQTKKQPNSIDCGYYVMKNMLDIVSANITGSWTEVFNDPKELSSDELVKIYLVLE